MANTFLTPSVFAQEALMHLENELVLGNYVHTDYSTEFQTVGDTISIRRPTQYLGQDDNLDITSYREDITQGKTTISMNRTVTIPVQIGAKDRTLSFDRLSEDVIRPAVIRMKDRIESELAALYKGLYWFDGTPGTPISQFSQLADAGAKMTEVAIPTGNRAAFHAPTTAAKLANEIKNVYVSEKARKAFEKAQVGTYGGFDNFETAHAPTHTSGVATGTPLVGAANQNVTYLAAKDSWSQTLNTTGWTPSTNGILKAGDVFTIAGVNSVNPVSKEDTGRLQTFVVLADANAGSGAGAAALTISPPIITSGAYQTVTAAPAASAPITVVSGDKGAKSKQSLLLTPKTFALVTRALDIPQGSGVKTSTKTGNKTVISVTEFVDGNTLAQTFRFDILFGVKTLDPRTGMRLTN